MSAARERASAGVCRRGLVLDVALVVVAASARVVVEHARGLVHAGSDLGAYFIPNATWWWSRARWLGGWNPWIFAGYPANADPQIAPLHPLSLPYAIASPLVAAALEGMLLPSLAGVGMLLYLRVAGCGRAGALIGALSFGLGGYLTGHVMHPGLLRAAAAVPWALAALEALDGRALVAALGAASGCLLLSGHPQGTAYAMAVVVAYALWLGHVRPPRRLATVGAALLLGLGLAAGALLPFAQLLARSARAAGASGGLANPTLGASALAGLWTPFALGGSIGPLYGETAARVAGCSLVECSGYAGLAVWIVVLCALPFVARDPRGRFWIALAAAALVLATGVPDLTAWGLRAPARFLLWWNLALAASAGFAWRALDATLRERAPRWWIGSAVAALVLVAIAAARLAPARAVAGSALLLVAATVGLVATRRRPRAAAAAVVALVAIDMTTFAASAPFGVPELAYRRGSALVDAVGVALRNDRASAPDALARAVVVPLLPDANRASLAQVPLAQGYSPLVPVTLARLLGQSGGSNEIGFVDPAVVADPASHALDLLRIGVVGVPASLPPLHDAPADDRAAPRWRALDAPGGTAVRFFANARARPVAWLVTRARVVPEDEAVRLVTRGGAAFDPAREALVREPVAGLGADASADGRVTLGAYGEDELLLHVDTAARALLVTSEPSFPGWQVEVDGRRAPLVDVNAGFRGVVVPPGRHAVRFVYRPLAGRLGLAISAVALIGLLWCAATAPRGRRGAAGRTPAPCPGS